MAIDLLPWRGRLHVVRYVFNRQSLTKYNAPRRRQPLRGWKSVNQPYSITPGYVATLFAWGQKECASPRHLSIRKLDELYFVLLFNIYIIYIFKYIIILLFTFLFYLFVFIYPNIHIHEYLYTYTYTYTYKYITLYLFDYFFMLYILISSCFYICN